VVVLTAAAQVVYTVRMVPSHGTIQTAHSGSQDHPPPIQKLGAENHMLQLNI